MTSSLFLRHQFQSSGVSLSYLDSGNDAPVIVALHALWMQASSFNAIGARLFPHWRIVALDQRGHGMSERSKDYSRDAFIGDIASLLDHLEITQPVVLLGNSLGGTNAFQFAARHPKRVSHLIVEEAPAKEEADLDWMKEWAGVFAGRAAFAKTTGPFFWSLEPSLMEVEGGVQLRFDIGDMRAIQRHTNGDWWHDWLASTCPALVLRGTQSKAVDAQMMSDMAARRPNTELLALEAGHVMHEDAVLATADAITRFLKPSP